MTNDAGGTRLPWHSLEVDDLLGRLTATANGLLSAEAAERLAVAGPNAMPAAPPVSKWRVLADQLRSVIVALLLAAAAISFLTGDLADTAAIAAVLVLNVGIGYAMEIGAHRAAEALSRLEARRATVLRDGVPQEIDARAVVPGDVLILEEGQAVPADARLLASAELRTVESALTGESLPVPKNADGVDAGASLPDRTNMVYAGTMVAAGAGKGIVIATGRATELGRIGALVNATRIERTPLEQRLDALGRLLVWTALIVGCLTSALAWWQQLPLVLVLQTGIALAVAAVPEGLPAVATITLAIGVRRMAQRRALVRRLPSVETLGSVTVICTDKTGTLTASAMQVTSIHSATRDFRVGGNGYEPKGSFDVGGREIDPADDPDLLTILRICALASRADVVRMASGWAARGDPTDAATVVAGRKGGIDRERLVARMPEVGDLPFSSRRRLMATFHRDGTRTLAFVKGAPERVLDLCGSIRQDGTERPITAMDLQAMLDANARMAAAGLRVIALASGAVSDVSESALVRLTLAGLAGINDPPAPGVREAIRTFKAAGVRTVMITGDQSGTALAIARELGLAEGSELLDGSQIDRLSDDELADRLRATSVFSRVSPEAKLRIVSGYQRNGEIVAMLGDGVNDAAALKKANVGVTMGGRGTDAAREAADVVLQDDRFETIGVAIEEGRVVFDNIRKFVFYLFSCNLAEIAVLLGSAAAGLAPPLLPIQILWLNLVTDTLPALALAAEPGVEAVMRRSPRNPRADIVSSGFARAVVLYGALIAAPVFLVMGWTARTGVAPMRAMTMTFMVLAFAQLLHLGNARDDRPVVRPHRALANMWALAAVVATSILQAATALWPPLRGFLRLTPLTSLDWAVVVAAALVPALVGQFLKGRVWRRR